MVEVLKKIEGGNYGWKPLKTGENVVEFLRNRWGQKWYPNCSGLFDPICWRVAGWLATVYSVRLALAAGGRFWSNSGSEIGFPACARPQSSPLCFLNTPRRFRSPPCSVAPNFSLLKLALQASAAFETTVTVRQPVWAALRMLQKGIIHASALRLTRFSWFLILRLRIMPSTFTQIRALRQSAVMAGGWLVDQIFDPIRWLVGG